MQNLANESLRIKRAQPIEKKNTDPISPPTPLPKKVVPKGSSLSPGGRSRVLSEITGDTYLSKKHTPFSNNYYIMLILTFNDTLILNI